MWLPLLPLFAVLGECCASGLRERTHTKQDSQLDKRRLTRTQFGSAANETLFEDSSNEALHDDSSSFVPRQVSKCTKGACASFKKGNRPFVVMRDGKMILEGGTPFRFASFNTPDLLAENDDFEAEDTIRTIAGLGRGVTRTYTLTIKGTSPHLGTAAHITGWNKHRKDWIYNEVMFRKMDRILALAFKHNVRLIIPFINQDTGLASNWVGNYVDLIIYRKNSTWDYNTARTKVDFFNDPEMIEGYKKIVTFLLKRVNTVTGVRYGADPTILAWQTGNELMYTDAAGKTGPAPGKWTAAVAAHIKSLAPRTLVIDGSFARQERFEDSHAPEALASPHVELMSYHYYSYDFIRILTEPAYIQGFGKGFIVDEYGFVPDTDLYKALLDAANAGGVVGTLAWSLRSHSTKGGFRTHREDEENAAYHAPGWPNPIIPAGSWVPSAKWDEKEYNIVKHIRDASFTINGDIVSDKYPLSLPPKVWLNANSTITWQGVPWAMSYEAWTTKSPSRAHVHGPFPDSRWTRIGQNLLDAVPAGTLAWPLPSGSRGLLRMRAIGPDGNTGVWSNVIRI